MWHFKDEIFDNILEEFDSFVYLIERLNIEEDQESPIFYVGKKTFYFKTKYKGKRIVVESDWYEYFGSSEWLTKDIERFGSHNFKRTILHLCRTKGDAGYLEAKEQIERNVLQISKNNYKLYYNKNILGRYRNEPEHYLVDEQLKNYYSLNNIHENNYGKKWITDGKINKLATMKIAEDIVNSSNWVFGKSEKQIEVNDGNDNFLISKSDFNENIHNIGFLKKYITNGIIDKLIPVHLIDNYINLNPSWYIGYSNNDDVWITNNKEEKKIKRDDLINYDGYSIGRKQPTLKNKISLFKDTKYIWVDEEDEAKYIREGWVKKGRTGGYKLYNVTDGLNQRSFRNEIEKQEFLSNNETWRDGQIPRENFNTKNTVFAKDIRTDKKVIVTTEEYKSNIYLTSVKTKKVKIKKKNRILFSGYLDLFIINNPQYPKQQLMNALRSPTGDLIIHKGKNKWISDECLNLRWL